VGSKEETPAKHRTSNSTFWELSELPWLSKEMASVLSSRMVSGLLAGQGLAAMARHVIDCHLTPATRVQIQGPADIARQRMPSKLDCSETRVHSA